MPAITQLPPGTERPALHFDIPAPLQFPVHVEYAGHDEFVSTGLDHSDIPTIHHTGHALGAYRKDKTVPDWAVNDALLREVLVRYVEYRANIAGSGTQEERLNRALQSLSARKKKLGAVLDKRCIHYAAMKKAGEPCDRLAQLIEMLDTEIGFMERADKLAAGVVYFYYRCGLNSVEVAEKIGAKPPHVRTVLWRLKRIYKRMQSGWVPRKSGPRGPHKKLPTYVKKLAR